MSKAKKVLTIIEARLIPIKNQKIVAEITIKAREYEEGNITFDIYKGNKQIISAVGIKQLPKAVTDILKTSIKM